MTTTAARLLLADDHTLFRDGLRELISHWDEFQVISEAANGEEAIARCREQTPHIVLMDVHMPVMDGVAATRLIHHEFPATAVVMLTMSVEEKNLFEAIKQGARGYILKNTSAQQLREQLNAVVRGEVPLSGAIAAKILDEFSRQQCGMASESSQPLTAREIHILRLVAEGLSNEEIGTQLHLSAQTVKKQLSTILQKLHLNNRVQAATYAVRTGLIQ